MINKEDKKLIQGLMGNDVFVSSKDSRKFSYISNSDGSIRWIYPSELEYPYFLNFYSTASFRAKFFSLLIKLAFYTKQSHRVKSGDMMVHISEKSNLGQILNNHITSGYSIFTGTVGENRKVIIEIHNNIGIYAFVKIALTDTAKELVANEARVLSLLQEIDFKTLVVPKILKNFDKGRVEISNIKPKKYWQDTKLKDIHLKSLYEMYESTKQIMLWNEMNFESIQDRLELLLGDYRILNNLEKSRVKKLSEKLYSLVEMVNKEKEEITVSMFHGDFTPWNIFVSDKKLYIFDWELSQMNSLLMIDIFHFIYQSEVMIRHASYNEIKKELEKVLSMDTSKQIIKIYDVDINRNYLYYIVDNITYYLLKYIKQKHLHEQVFWLMNVWEEAVSDLVRMKGNIFETRMY